MASDWLGAERREPIKQFYGKLFTYNAVILGHNAFSSEQCSQPFLLKMSIVGEGIGQAVRLNARALALKVSSGLVSAAQ